MNWNETSYLPTYMLARDHLLSVIFPHTAFYILWFHYLGATVTGDYLVMHTRLDELILFLPVFIVPCPLWFVYTSAALLYFNRTDKGEVANLCFFLSPSMTVVLFICTVFPNGTDLRAPADPINGSFASLVRMTRSTDTPTNALPSIHASNVLAVHAMVTRSRSLTCRPSIRRTSLTLMLLICPSTVFLKRYSVLDVFGALLFGYFVNAVIYGSCEIPALIPTGADVLLRRKENPAKAYRQLRKK